jgi:hypothetical protein
MLLGAGALLTGLWGYRKDLRSPKKGERAVALAMLAVAAALIFAKEKAAYQDRVRRQQAFEQELEENGVGRDFLERLIQPEVAEASGGAVIGDTAYIVDDELRFLFAFPYDSAKRRYAAPDTTPFVRCDGTGQVLDTLRPDDLEGVAAHDGDLFVTTSHSTNRRHERPRDRGLFLRLTRRDRGWCATRAPELIEPVLGTLRRRYGATLVQLRDRNRLDSLEIEGLAIDPAGTAYLGLRTPTVDRGSVRHAIVLSAPVDSLMRGADTTTFSAWLLPLNVGKTAYAITSLDWDERTKSLLVLGGSQLGDDYTLPPRLWRWAPTRGRDLQPVQLVDSLPVRLPRGARAKAEVVLAPADHDSLFFFLDAEGYGGQRAIRRP